MAWPNSTLLERCRQGDDLAWEALGADCVPDATTLCLQGRKFAVQIDWQKFDTTAGHGHATPLSSESGDFWFFDAGNNEAIIKIIDACSFNGNYWVFWDALSNVKMDLTIRDTVTNQILVYHNDLGFSPNGELNTSSVFRCDGTGPAATHINTRTDLPAPGVPQLQKYDDPSQIGACVAQGDGTACFQSGRFRVSGTWRDFTEHTGPAHVIPKNDQSGYLWFFNAANFEGLFKIIDGCGFNGHYWVFNAGLTNVEATLEIVDTRTGDVYIQRNNLGVDYPTNLDISTNFTGCTAPPVVLFKDGFASGNTSAWSSVVP
ncbi:MAG: hypothetical protein ABI689_08850 [Thermoanaerobaculia bacterium]